MAVVLNVTSVSQTTAVLTIGERWKSLLPHDLLFVAAPDQTEWRDSIDGTITPVGWKSNHCIAVQQIGSLSHETNLSTIALCLSSDTSNNWHPVWKCHQYNQALYDYLTESGKILVWAILWNSWGHRPVRWVHKYNHRKFLSKGISKNLKAWYSVVEGSFFSFHYCSYFTISFSICQLKVN